VRVALRLLDEVSDLDAGFRKGEVEARRRVLDGLVKS
jgi:hypothetical protein